MSEQPETPARPVRRAPNIVAFLLTGTFIGIVVGGLLGLQATGLDYSRVTAAGLMAVIGGVIGAIAGGVAVALIEYRSLR